MASSSIVLFPAMIMSSRKFRIPKKLTKIRAQSYRDEGMYDISFHFLLFIPILIAQYNILTLSDYLNVYARNLE